MTRSDVMRIRRFEPTDQSEVIKLWDSCDLLRPWNDPTKDIQRKLKVRPDQFLVGELDGRVVATAMVGYDGHRGWIYYLAVDPVCHRRGFGRAIVDEAEKLLREAGCPKINLQVRTSNSAVIEFYRAIGFVQDDVLSMGKRLESDLA